MEKKVREEIVGFFASRGERCLKIIPLKSHHEGTEDFNCVVVTPSGKKENAFISLQKAVSSSKMAPASYSL